MTYVSHNAADIDCSHPYAVAAATYLFRSKEAYHASLKKKCGDTDFIRPACERRVVKTKLDTILLLIFCAVCVFEVAQDLQVPSWAGA